MRALALVVGLVVAIAFAVVLVVVATASIFAWWLHGLAAG
jgi:hypothetical protein